MTDSGFYLWLGFRLLLMGLLVVFLVKGLDDLLLDAILLVRRGVRRFFGLWTPELPDPADASRIAVLLPWSSRAAAPRSLLRHQSLDPDYRDFLLFVGVPEGDDQTSSEASSVNSVLPRIQIVECRSNEPAEELNELYAAASDWAEREGKPFEWFVVLPPGALLHPAVFHHLNESDASLVHIANLPDGIVPPLSAANAYRLAALADLTGELPARDAAGYPPAMMGTSYAIRRALLDAAAARQGGSPFTAETVDAGGWSPQAAESGTGEDFLLAYSPAEHRFAPPRTLSRGMPIGAWVCLPDSFSACVKARASQLRGRTGASHESRNRGGWYGAARDRRLAFYQLGYLPAYLTAAYALTAWILSQAREEPLPATPLVGGDEWWSSVLLIVAATFVWRMLAGMVRLARARGPGALIPFLVLTPLRHVMDGLAATACHFPMALKSASAETVSIFRPWWPAPLLPPSTGSAATAAPGKSPAQGAEPPPAPSGGATRLGEILIREGHLTEEELETALEEQSRSGEKLGELLIRRGILQEEDVVEALAQRHQKTSIEIDPYATSPEILGLVPRPLAERYRVFPLGSDGATVILATDVLNPGTREDELSVLLGRPVSFQWTSSVDIGFAIERAYGRVIQSPPKLSERLGPRLLRKGIITEDQLRAGLRVQKRTGKRLGDILVEEGFVSRAVLEGAIE